VASDDYIAWAQLWCPEPLAPEPAPFPEAKIAYDAADERIGDDAEHDEFLSRVLWLETAIRLARLGWTIRQLEDARWPVPRTARLSDLIRRGV
jgi:hypothetical protein